MESGWLSLWRKRRYSFCIFKGRWWLYRQNAPKSQGDYSFPSSFRNAFWWGKSCFGALHYANSLSLLIEFWEGKKTYTVFYFAYVLIVAVVLIRHRRATLMPSTLRVYRKLLCVRYFKCTRCSSDAFPYLVACWALVGGLAPQSSWGFSLSVCVSFSKWLSLVCRISQTF